MFGLHPLDLAIILTYLVVVFYVGLRNRSRKNDNQEGFFLANRGLGKVYQFFLNFGNATDANAAVSSASIVYQQGVAGIWMGFQLIFLNPYYWFMNLWFRRTRLVTMADLFTDRLGSPGLARFYAIFQSLTAVIIIIGFGNLITLKISSAIITTPVEAWTPAEVASVEGYRELNAIEKTLETTPVAQLSAETQTRLTELRELDARGELRSSITPLRPLPFYLIYSLIVGAYIILGGMAAAAANEIIQGLLIILFSAILLPLGFAAIGGAAQLSERVPAEMFELIQSGSQGQQFTLLVLGGILINSFIFITAIPGNMPIAGSAKDEYAARFGAVSGTYAKRLMLIMWGFCGLIALAIFSGPKTLADPDTVWGALSHELLGPGLLGLMITGVLAANMSTVAAQSMAVSGLLVRNVVLPFRPQTTDQESITFGRWVIGIVLGLGILAALGMTDVFSMLNLMLTINVPFGAAILLIFLWRRLTVPAVWIGVIVAFIFSTFAPVVLPKVVPSLYENQSLTIRTTDETGKFYPVYFENVVRTVPDDPTSPLIGEGRLRTELLLLNVIGIDVTAMSSSHRYAARLYTTAIIPFVLLILISLMTRAPAQSIVAAFYGKMKTPVAATPELDETVMAETNRHPTRYDHTKVFSHSSWEFTKWNRTDTVGFFACCIISSAIVALFWGLLRWAAP